MDVEFVATDPEDHRDVADDDVLSVGSDRRRLPVWVVRAGAALTAAVVLVAGGSWLTHRPASRPVAAATTTSSVRPSPTLSLPPTTVLSAGSCPYGVSCATTAQLPDEVRAAILGRLGRAQVHAASSVHVVGAGLWFRQVSGTIGPLGLLIRVTRDAAAGVNDPLPVDGGPMTTFVRLEERGYVVQIAVAGPSRDLPPIATLYGLAADPRLVVDA